MTDPHASAPLIFLSAGEVSGDHYGAEIIERLHAQLPSATFTGLGGLAMERAGQRRLIRAEDVAVMGITEILRHIPRVIHSYRQLVRAIRQAPPAVAVLIDFPDVNFRLARHLRRLGVPVVWFASPQLWAWKRRRLRWVQSRVDRMLVLFPFEERFYRARGVAAEFVGHPLAHQPRNFRSREAFAAEHGLDPEARWLALLPGSRMRELTANLPEMLHAAHSLAEEKLGPLQVVLPLASGLDPLPVRALLAATVPDLHVTLLPDAAEALHHARAAAVASGTATVLAAVIGTPFAVVYRVSPLTFALARRLVRYPPELPAEPDPVSGTLPIAMVNLLAGHRVVPELLNEHFTAAALAEALAPLLEETPARAAQKEQLAVVRSSLLVDSPTTGTDRVAEIVLEMLQPRFSTPDAVQVRSAIRRV